MNKLLALSAAALFALSGCVVHTADRVDPAPPPPPPVVVPVNFAPIVVAAEVGVYWDDFHVDDIWYFEAEVDDPDGPLDVISVWADVYDGYTGIYIESFELFPTSDPFLWYSDWLGHTTLLDPFYADYQIDIIAYDSYEEFDAVTVFPYTY